MRGASFAAGAALLGLLPLLAGCLGETPVEPGEPGLGIRLRAAPSVLDLTWVPGTQVLVFRTAVTASTSCSLRAFDLRDHSEITLDTSCTRTPFFAGGVLRGIAVSGDGGVLAYQLGVAAPEPFGSVARVISPWGGEPREVARASLLWAALAISADGRRLAYSRTFGDTVTVLDLQTADTITFQGGKPLAFSPDGSELLFQVGPPSVWRRVLATGAEQRLQLGLSVTDIPGPMVWDSRGLWLYVDRFDGGAVVRNLTAGTSVVVAEYEPLKRVREVTWLRDQRRVGFWEERCSSSGSAGSCEVTETRLIVADRDSGERTVVASTVGVGGPMAFAPDSRSVVYQLDGALYMSRVP
ncbi:MAG TPA: hypothetical protein VNL98_13375 [Gemmatimonadales bacterium]|nr:hypothetical protein [Gemmatimonadales bacterium]